jgi:hypothetical protein
MIAAGAGTGTGMGAGVTVGCTAGGTATGFAFAARLPRVFAFGAAMGSGNVVDVAGGAA